MQRLKETHPQSNPQVRGSQLQGHCGKKCSEKCFFLEIAGAKAKEVQLKLGRK